MRFLADLNAKSFTLTVDLAAQKPEKLTLTLTHNVSKHIFAHVITTGQDLTELSEVLIPAAAENKFTLKPADEVCLRLFR